MGKKLSVVVPIYNVSNYLEECLDSFLKQEIDDYEIIMVDDGSTDNSYEIAENYAQAYPNFFAYTKPNGGLGHARNYGAALATGDFITFVDSDDIIPAQSYRVMLERILATGSDFVIGNVRRFNTSRQFASTLHDRVFSEDLEEVHVSNHLELLYDTTAWNKIYKMSFWRDNQLTFPEGMLYEDIPVTIPSHILASKVDVVTKVTYLWRARDEGDKSITQQRSDINNLGDRLKAIEMAWQFMVTHETPQQIKDAFDVKNLEMDFQIYLNYLNEGNPEFNEMLLTYLNSYLSHVNETSIMALPVLKRLNYRLLQQGKVKEFIELTRLNSARELNQKPVIRDNHYYYDYPYQEVLTAEERIADNEFNAITKIEQVQWQKGLAIKLRGFVYIQRVDAKTPQKINVRVSLVNQDGSHEITVTDNLPLIAREDVTTLRGVRPKDKGPLKRLYDYTFSGFDLTFNFGDYLAELQETSYYLKLTVTNDFLTKEVILKNPAAGYRTRPKYKLQGLKQIFPHYNSSWELKFAVTELAQVISSSKVEGDHLVLAGQSRSELPPRLETHFYTETNPERLDITAEAFKLEGDNFSTSFSLASLDFTKQYREYDLIGKKGMAEVGLAESLQGKVLPFSPLKQLKLDYTADNELKLVVSNYQAYIQRGKFQDNHLNLVLQVRSEFSGTPAGADLYLAFVNGEQETKIKPSARRLLEKQGLEELTFNFPVIADGQVVLPEKLYNISLRVPLAEPIVLETGVEQAYNEAGLYFINNGVDYYRLDQDGYRLQMYHRVGSYRAFFRQSSFLEKRAYGPRRQGVLRDYLYRIWRKLPLKNIAVYETYWGREFGCNPQAIAEYVGEHRPNVKNVAFVDDDFVKIPGNIETVKIGSVKYYYYLARAKYLFNNVNFPDFYKKRRGAIEVQTMHGTPLKKLGLDAPDEIKPNYVKNYLKKNNRWDLLIIPSDYVGEIAKSAFGYEKKMLPAGYPRNDKLFADNNPANIAALREKYRIPADKKVLLYAPTWRTKGNFSLALNLRKMQQQLGDEYVLLIKLHHFSKRNFSLAGFENFAMDVTQNSEIRELYLVADVLITDYSSVMFDFALLRKPMLFFTYDYEKYKDELRGFYFDFQAEAPGSLVQTTDELLKELADMPAYTAKNSERYAQFCHKFNQYDTGHAAEQLINHIMPK